MLDLDVSASILNGTNSSSLNGRLTLLHALTTDLVPSTQRLLGSLTPTNGTNGTTDSILLSATSSPSSNPAPYIGPSPPNTDTTPHRYVSLVFEQPASGLQIAPGGFEDIQDRIDFDVQGFMGQNGLAEPLAGNFFVVDGTMADAGFNGSETGSGGVGGPTGQPRLFDGGAGERRGGKWLAVGVAVVVGFLV
jgi:hypothetical protein